MFLFTILYYFALLIGAFVMFIGLYAIINETIKHYRRRNAEKV